MSDAGIEILLLFISTFFSLLAQVFTSDKLVAFARKLPKTIYRAKKLIGANVDNFLRYTVCPKCYHLYPVESCKVQLADGSIVSKLCDHVEFPEHPHITQRQPCTTVLMKKVKTSAGTTVLCPHSLFCYKSIIESLQAFLYRPDFIPKCELWRQRQVLDGIYSDIYDGQVWNNFLSINGIPFLSLPYKLAFSINVDWFQPFRHTTYSVGAHAMYIAVLNLPREECYLPENIILLGVIPGPKEPKLHLNSFLTPFVNELLKLWDGVELKTNHNLTVIVRAALLSVNCDIPAGRKVSGFLGPQALKGCSVCDISFPTEKFGEKPDYSNFDRSTWKPRNSVMHSILAAKHHSCKTMQERKDLEHSHGICFSVLTQLPYFKASQMTVIDPMHNLLLGTAKYILNVWKELQFLSAKDFVEIQNLVDSFVVPSDIGRIRLKIASGFAEFTADQWRSWIVYYSLPALNPLMDGNEFRRLKPRPLHQSP